MKPIDRYTCAEVLRRLDDYLDRQLSEAETKLVKEHLETCVRCASEHKFESQMIDAVREKMQRVEVPEGLIDRVARRLRDTG